MRRILVGTSEGVLDVPGGAPPALAGRDVLGLARFGDGLLALVAGNELWRMDAAGERRQAVVDAPAANCLLASSAGVFVGTAEARLALLDDAGAVPVTGFDTVPTRGDWYTPRGGPPDVRSLAEDAGGDLYANVHVGGILRSTDGGRRWAPTALDIDADVHQVVAHPSKAGHLYAATAYGLALSADAGANWETIDAGLDEVYCRAVAVAGDTLIVTAADSHRGKHSAVYRRPLDAGTFERCRKGLPEEFSDNIDTYRLTSAGPVAAFATPEGDVMVSEDEGGSWERAAGGLPPVRCLIIV